MRSVIRLDSLPVGKAKETPEGYLMDRPVLTSTGIFEYQNPDGSTRRELRLPEDVFDEESLKSYLGKPVVITHDAGLIDKGNVHRNQIGTILSVGKKSGNDVRADIIIHDTNELRDCGLKELSLGYNLDLEETPGTWHGQEYDAIQRNIRINHLALVREARAGDRARLNIDGRSSEEIEILKGGKVMAKKKIRNDGVLSPDELLKAIEEYKKRRQTASDAEDEEIVEEKVTVPAKEEKPVPEEASVEEKIEAVKGRRDRRDEEGDPEDKESALGMIANQDEDISTLFDIIDTLLAEREFKEAKKEDGCGKRRDADDEEIVEEEEEFAEDADPEDDEDFMVEEIAEKEDADDEIEETEEEEELAEDEDDEEEFIDEEKEEKLNMDGVDKIVRTRIKIGMIGRKINLDGLENMSIRSAKKAVIKAVRPTINLDGKSTSYINAAYRMAVDEIENATKKDTRSQKKQMFNKKTARADGVEGESAEARYRAMIARQTNRV